VALSVIARQTCSRGCGIRISLRIALEAISKPVDDC
jgi:hypothetical protein